MMRKTKIWSVTCLVSIFLVIAFARLPGDEGKICEQACNYACFKIYECLESDDSNMYLVCRNRCLEDFTEHECRILYEVLRQMTCEEIRAWINGSG